MNIQEKYNIWKRKREMENNISGMIIYNNTYFIINDSIIDNDHNNYYICHKIFLNYEEKVPLIKKDKVLINYFDVVNEDGLLYYNPKE